MNLAFSVRKDEQYMKNPRRSQSSGKSDFATRSNLYREFLAERDEILRHKWIESEKVGYDVGFERALLDWIRRHRDDWRKSRRDSDSNEASTGAA